MSKSLEVKILTTKELGACRSRCPYPVLLAHDRATSVAGTRLDVTSGLWIFPGYGPPSSLLTQIGAWLGLTVIGRIGPLSPNPESPAGRGFYKRLSAGLSTLPVENFPEKSSRSLLMCRTLLSPDIPSKRKLPMRKHFIAFVAAIALMTVGGSVLALAQTALRPATTTKTFGFQDSRGTFHPLGAMPDASDATASTTTYTGTIETTVTITLKTALPKGGTVGCRVDADPSSDGASGDVSYEESASSVATVSGSTATCKVNIPFSWLLFTPSTVSGKTQINTITGSLDVTMYSPVTTSIVGLEEDVARDHTQVIVINGGVVADGTLTVAAAVTL